jgi:hypothetical protein
MYTSILGSIATMRIVTLVMYSSTYPKLLVRNS